MIRFFFLIRVIAEINRRLLLRKPRAPPAIRTTAYLGGGPEVAEKNANGTKGSCAGGMPHPQWLFFRFAFFYGMSSRPGRFSTKYAGVFTKPDERMQPDWIGSFFTPEA
jgi:hypothetical protein